MTKVIVDLEMTMSALVQIYSESYRRGVDAACEAESCGAANGPFDARPLSRLEALEAAHNIFRLLLEGSEDSGVPQ